MAYLTPDNIRDRVPAIAGDTTNFTDEVLEELVEEFEDIAEQYLGVAYEPRTLTETVDICHRRVFLTKWPRVTAVSDLTIDGVDVQTAYTFTNGWSIDLQSRFTGVLSVTYTHGYTEPPKAILRACREYVRSCALADRSGVPRDVISQSGDGTTTRYSTPDAKAGRPTGWVEVDRLLNTVRNERVPVVA